MSGSKRHSVYVPDTETSLGICREHSNHWRIQKERTWHTVWIQFLSFSCNFGGKWPDNRLPTPPLELHPPPLTGESWICHWQWKNRAMCQNRQMLGIVRHVFAAPLVLCMRENSKGCGLCTVNSIFCKWTPIYIHVHVATVTLKQIARRKNY